LAAEHDAAVIFAHVAPALDVVPLAIYGIGGALPRMPHELTTLDRVPLEEVEQLAAEDGVRSSSKLLVGDTVDEIGKPTAAPAAPSLLDGWLTPATVAIFGGVVDPTKLHFPFTHMQASDARDWNAVSSWAHELAVL
jgi:hypothetical protein